MTKPYHPSLEAISNSLKAAGKAAVKFFGTLSSANEDDFALAVSARNALDIAKARKIKTPAEFEAQAEDLRRLAAIKKNLEAARKSITTDIDAAKKGAQTFFKPMLEFVEEAEKLEKKALADYLDREEAKNKATLAKQSDKALKLHAEADAASAAGDMATATKLRAKANAASSAGVTTTKSAGISSSTTYHACVFDPRALILAVADGRVPSEALVVNQSWLDEQAQQLKQDFNYPGVRLETGKRIAVRA